MSGPARRPRTLAAAGHSVAWFATVALPCCALLVFAALVPAPWPDVIDGGRDDLYRSVQVVLVGVGFVIIGGVGMLCTAGAHLVARLRR